MRKIIYIMIASLVCVGAMNADAQNFTVKGDLVSSYVWRGMYQTGVSIQPTLGFQIKDFAIVAWGSTDFDGVSSSAGEAAKEFDLTVSYTIPKIGLAISIADLWWAGQGAKDYFDYKSNSTAHYFEAGLCYTLPFTKFPLSIAWNTMFAGADKDIEGNQNYSSYIELNYPFSVKKVDLNVTCGVVPYNAINQYGNANFAVTNVALKGTYNIKCSESFSIPIFSQVICNPLTKNINFVFGLTLGIL